MSHAAVPLLVQVVSGNPATSAGVLLCLNTHDATNLRRVHPVLLRTVAGVPWCDMAATIHDVRRWRGALPVAVGAKLPHRLPSLDPVLLAGLISLNVQSCNTITDAVVQRLPPTLHHLAVSFCCNLTVGASFTHLPALTSLDCGYTAALDTGLEALPPSLQVLCMVGRGFMLSLHAIPVPASFHHLRALRVLNWTMGAATSDAYATLPPTLEELDISFHATAARSMVLANLPRLRVFRAGHSIRPATRRHRAVRSAWVR